MANAETQYIVETGDFPILSSAKYNPDDVLANANEFAEIHGDRPAKHLFLGGRPYRVDFKKLAGAVQLFADEFKKKGVITAGFLRQLPYFFEVPASKERDALALTPVPSYTVDFHYGAVDTDWPHKGVLYGAWIVAGDTGSGKTTHIVEKTDCVLIRYGEPFENADFMVDEATGLYRSVQASNLLAALNMATILGAVGIPVAIDSLRLVVYGLSGNPGEGGMITAVFDLVTQISNFCADTGVLMVVAVNPMLADLTKMGNLVRRLAASCGGVIHISEGRVVYKTGRLVNGRVFSEGLESSDIPGEVTQGSDPTGRLSRKGLERDDEMSSLISVYGIKEKSDIRTRVGTSLNPSDPIPDSDNRDQDRPSFDFNL